MEKLERIEQYLTGKLSGGDLQAFEQEIKQDPGLEAEVSSYRQLIDGIEAAGVSDFEQKLQTWERQILNEEAEKLQGGAMIRPMWLRYAAVAAAVLALVAILFLYRPGTEGPVDSETLFAQHFQPMEDYLSLKGAARPEDSAMELYQAGKYHEALPLFEQVLKQDSIAPLFQLYAAIAYTADQQPDKAIRLLTPLTEIHNSYSEPAEWYLALAELRAGNLDKARKQLQGFVKSNKNHSYREAAIQLLEGLGSE